MEERREGGGRMPLRRGNYVLLLLGCGLILLGYALMSGGGSSDPSEFNPAIFDFRRITLSPIVCVSGFALCIVGLMRRGRAE